MLGNRIKQLREEKEISQKDLANLLHISPSTVGMYKQGRRTPSSEILSIMATHFKVSVDYLLGRNDNLMYNQNNLEDLTIKYLIRIEKLKAMINEELNNWTNNSSENIKTFADMIKIYEFKLKV
ncbi:helix-turn-helix transcriptional regulator [Clostridium botulinum]|nr:helix-turn-helix transcriptional regulator [Clostridium botulinum]MBY6818459.1 helix-turn-helix transcriptional regulator [Clostridium botulinum]MBY6824450.1 helix-turn-helix transcriptional regulator [Clostridium botulinum]MBY6828753.1 helix-turn-helix transcriptional regulator [Clostridium botulinum]MBY6832682.1 helix-turn-helix transcriptional regulator [Clostridium botulinum]